MLVCEMAAFYLRQNKSLLDVLADLYAEHGVYRHETINAAFEGAAGMETMNRIMDTLRSNPPHAIAGLKLIRFSDYWNSCQEDIGTGAVTPLTLPKSNVLAFALEGNAGLVIRPSGTEPKIKAYVTATGADTEKADKMTVLLSEAAQSMLNA